VSILVTQTSAKSFVFDESSAGDAAANVPGLVVIWSTITPHRPEFVFHAPSPVLAAKWFEDDPSFVIGGCYSGQLLLWDMRGKKALPVHRSSLAGRGHKYPICGIHFSGGSAGNSLANAAECFTLSVDGMVCQWDISHLSDPIQVYLTPPPPQQSATTTSNAMVLSTADFGSDEIGHGIAVYGTGAGQLEPQSFPQRSFQSKASVDAHSGFITAIDLHPSSRQLYRNLFLTSSVDWTIKLWQLGAGIASPASLLVSFQSPAYDYVSDVKWHPTNPNAFAAVTSSGELLVYDLRRDAVEPVERIVVNKLWSESQSTAAATSTGAAALASALQKLRWSADGNQLFIGDARGMVFCFYVQNSLQQVAPGDDTKFELHLLAWKPSSPSSSSSAAVTLNRSG
jgi:dynein intermediate chain, cytosolic